MSVLRGERNRWEHLAKDPYYAVLNEEVHRDASGTERSRAEFFASGERDVANVLDAVHQFIDPSFRPEHTIDYGCGVGRLVIPLAKISDTVTGVDISQAMLDEAERNCTQRDVRNVRFQLASDFLAAPFQRDADFVHSYIVIQHIPPALGERVFRTLVARLRPGGVGALHLTYARRASRARRLANLLRRRVPGMNLLANLVQHRPLTEPQIPMHNYDLGRLISFLADQGCAAVHALPTDHGGHLGAMLIFQTP